MSGSALATVALRRMWIVTAVGLVAELVTDALAWSHLPDRIAIHFSGGHADGYSGKPVALLSGPVALLLLTLFVTPFLSFGSVRPGREKSLTSFPGFWIVFVLLLYGVELFVILNSLQ